MPHSGILRSARGQTELRGPLEAHEEETALFVFAVGLLVVALTGLLVTFAVAVIVVVVVLIRQIAPGDAPLLFRAQLDKVDPLGVLLSRYRVCIHHWHVPRPLMPGASQLARTRSHLESVGRVPVEKTVGAKWAVEK